MIKQLTKLASHLDSKGLRKEADYLDAVIRKIAWGTVSTKGTESTESTESTEGTEGTEDTQSAEGTQSINVAQAVSNCSGVGINHQVEVTTRNTSTWTRKLFDDTKAFLNSINNTSHINFTASLLKPFESK